MAVSAQQLAIRPKSVRCKMMLPFPTGSTLALRLEYAWSSISAQSVGGNFCNRWVAPFGIGGWHLLNDSKRPGGWLLIIAVQSAHPPSGDGGYRKRAQSVGGTFWNRRVLAMRGDRLPPLKQSSSILPMQRSDHPNQQFRWQILSVRKGEIPLGATVSGQLLNQ